MINAAALCVAPDNVISEDLNNPHHYREAALL